MDNIQQEKADQKSIEILAQAVTAAIKNNEGDQRFIDTKRIPLLCLNMSNIDKTLERFMVDVNVIFDEIRVMIKEMKAEEDRKHETFLTKESFDQQFTPYKKALNMIGGLVLVGVVGAIISLVLIK